MNSKFINRMPVSKSEFRLMVQETQDKLSSLSTLLNQLIDLYQESISQKLFTKAELQPLLESISKLLNSQNQSLQPQFLSLGEEINNLTAALTVFQEQYASTQTKLLCDISELTQNISGIIGSLSVLIQRETPLDVTFERNYYKNFLEDAQFGTSFFKNTFLSLIDNLDHDSLETIVTSLTRLQTLQQNNAPILALYSIKEKEIMKHRTDMLYSNILKLSDDCYFFDGYMLPINHFEMNVFLDQCGAPYLDIERLENKDIIDAGAFIGDSALVLSKFTSKTVHAFEPDPENYTLMKKTLQINKATNILPCQYALGSTKGFISLSTYKSASTQFANEAFNYDSVISAPVITLDSYVKENNLTVGLIKADVEGAEQLLLQGALDTIKHQRPALLISIYHNADDFFHIKPLIESLNLGYKFKIIHPICGTVMTETFLVAEV